MSHQSDKAKWDALAEMLGARVNPPEEPRQPLQENKAIPRVHLDLPPSPRKRADWDSLATELGATSTHRPEPTTAAPSRVPPAGGDREAVPRAFRASPQTQHNDERDKAVAGSTAGPTSTEIPEESDRVTLAEDGMFVAEDSSASDAERRPTRRRRRRGQRQREATGAERAIRRACDSEDVEHRHADPGPQRLPAEPREGGDGAKRSGHKSVPSWSEAVTLMIDGNLASRSTRRRSGPNGGRTRGRRGSKRS
jgi:hypothetical protein